MKRRGGPVDVAKLVSQVLARTGKDQVDAAALNDVVEALAAVDRPDLAAEWALKAWRVATADDNRQEASRAAASMMRLGPDGRRALRQL